MTENWKVYKETISRPYGHRIYEVSDQGNAKINGVLIDFSAYAKTRKGYYGIGHFYMHRAVAELFVPNPNNYNEVDHINGDKYDNRAVNLRWCTHKMNFENEVTVTRRKKAAQDPIRNDKISKSLTGQKRSDEQRAYMSLRHKHCKSALNHKWITNGVHTTHVNVNDLDLWFGLGYHLGRK